MAPLQHESNAVAGRFGLDLRGVHAGQRVDPAGGLDAESHASIVENAVPDGPLCQIAWLSWCPIAAMRASST